MLIRVFLTLFIMAVSAGITPAAAGLYQKRALLISSYNPSFPTFFQQIEGIRESLPKEDVLLDVEFMDAKRFNTQEAKDKFYSLLTYKLNSLPKYDILLTADDAALHFVRRHKETLFADIPIVFFGLNNLNLGYSLSRTKDITGVLEEGSFQETISLIWKLCPKVTTLYAISDATPSGEADLKNYLRFKEHFPNKKLEYLSLVTITWEELQNTIREFDETKAILLLSAYRDKKDERVNFSTGMERILLNSSVPVFHLWMHGIGKGLVGGKVVSHRNQGKLAGELARQIMGGKPSPAVVSAESANLVVVDYNQLQRFNISPEALPAGATILNKPATVIEQLRNAPFFGVTLTLGILFILVLLGMFVGSRRRS